MVTVDQTTVSHIAADQHAGLTVPNGWGVSMTIPIDLARTTSRKLFNGVE